MRYIDLVTQAYVECALWSSIGDDCEPLDDNYDESDISEEARAEMRKDVESFVELIKDMDSSDWSDEQLGHDFWLTRNGHGAGFWDRGWDNGKELSKAAKSFGECNLMVDDEGGLFIC